MGVIWVRVWKYLLGIRDMFDNEKETKTVTEVQIYAIQTNLNGDTRLDNQNRMLLGTYIVGQDHNLFRLETKPILFLRIVFSPPSTMLRLVTNLGHEITYTDVVSMLRSSNKIISRYREDEWSGINSMGGNQLPPEREDTLAKHGDKRKPRWTVYYSISGYGRNGKPVFGDKHMIVEANTAEEAIEKVHNMHHKHVRVVVDYAVKGEEDRRNAR